MIREFIKMACLACICLSPVSLAYAQSRLDITGSLDAPTARRFADELTRLVETKGVRPRGIDEYEGEKKQLYLALGDGAATVDRKTLHLAASRLLKTLDSDNHSFIVPSDILVRSSSATSPTQAASSDVARIVATAYGPVLVIRPPQVTYSDASQMWDYVRALLTRINEEVARSSPCALAVDLSEQKGGNVWPQVIALSALFTPRNTARLVDRNGDLKPVVSPHYMDLINGVGPLPESSLQKYVGTPVGVAMSSVTSSAGEMLAILFRGEEKNRIFGEPSAGFATSNTTSELPGGFTLALTSHRYVVGNGLPIRGRLFPDFPISLSKSFERAVLAAAEWSSQQSSLCAK